MIPEVEAMEFVNEMSRATGLLVSFGLNAYYVDPELNSVFVVHIDPSYLSGDEESKLEAFTERKGLRVDEAWCDWGRFLRISKPRRVSARAQLWGLRIKKNGFSFSF